MSKELRILIVEDSAADAELVARELVKGGLAHTSKWAKSKDEFLKALGEYAPDIILCDYKMPGFSAPEALGIVKKSYPETPFIVISGTIGEDVAVEMMKSGAADYVMKDKIFKLVPAVKRALEESEDRTGNKKAEEELKESEARFKAIFNESTDGMLLADSETRRFLMCNPKICRMLGYSEEELMRMRVDDIHPKDDLSFVLKQFERQAKGEIKLIAGLPVKRKDGSIFYADVNTSRITLSNKKYLMGSFRNITDTKKIQDELVEKVQDLERFSKFAVDREL
ncbi:MAG: PAS domain S-box protein, partial [Candidatus Omnitrophota bacterium]